MSTTEVAMENNNEQATATEVADDLPSFQRMIFHNFCQEEFDKYLGMMNVTCSMFFQFFQ